MENILYTIGLNEYEQKVYMLLLSIGNAGPSEIEKKSGLHRPIVYSALEALILKGLVSISPKGKRKLYVPVSPSKLEERFRKIEDDFFEKIEDLHELYEKSQQEKMNVSFSEGKQAILDSYLDIPHTLAKDGKYFRYSAIDAYNRDRYLPKTYRLQRDKNGLERDIITTESSKKPSQRLGSRVKVFPKDFGITDLNVGQTIYGDKVAIIDYDTQNVITIKNKKFAELQKKIFNYVFKNIENK